MATKEVEVLDDGTQVRIVGEPGKRFTVIQADWIDGREVDHLLRIDGGKGSPYRSIPRDRLVVVAPPRRRSTT